MGEVDPTHVPNPQTTNSPKAQFVAADLQRDLSPVAKQIHRHARPTDHSLECQRRRAHLWRDRARNLRHVRFLFLSSRDEGLPERDGGDEFVEGEGELGDGEEVVLVLEQAVDHGLGHQLELEDGRVDAGALAGADLAACKSYSK